MRGFNGKAVSEADITVTVSEPDQRGQATIVCMFRGERRHADKFDPVSDFHREKFAEASWGRLPADVVHCLAYDQPDNPAPWRFVSEQVLAKALSASDDGGDKFSIRRLTSGEFDSGDFSKSYLVEDILVECEPLVIAAALKSMKTTLAVALAIALALGRAFLGKFWVREAVNVLLLSGESGLSSLQSIGRRIAASYGVELADVERLYWSTDLPRLGNVEHLEAFREALTRDEIKVVVCDPLYFMLPGNDANNLMIVGGYLRTLTAGRANRRRGQVAAFPRWALVVGASAQRSYRTVVGTHSGRMRRGGQGLPSGCTVPRRWSESPPRGSLALPARIRPTAGSNPGRRPHGTRV